MSTSFVISGILNEKHSNCYYYTRVRILYNSDCKNKLTRRDISMTKTELVAKMAKDSDISKETAGKAMASMIDGIVKTLKKGKKVTLVGFGTFSVSKRKARAGRNPRTGEPIKIAAHKTPKFAAGRAFKNAIKK
jgi:DNA-binding protein HU-beta